MTDWKIRPRSNSCRLCGRLFEDGEICHSAVAVVPGTEGLDALFPDDAGGDSQKQPPQMQRFDFCVKCAAQAVGVAWTSVWRGKYAAPPPSEPEAVPKETAESLLRKLLDSEDPDNVSLAFLLAVMLERKKILIEKSVKRQPEGGVVRIYEHKKNAEVFFITDPGLSEEQIPELKSRMDSLLSGHPHDPDGTEQNPN